MLSRLWSNIGRGLIAGLIGTAAMAASSSIEMRIRSRKASEAPQQAASEVLEIEDFESHRAATRFGTLVHWAYGTAWGAVRGLLGSLLPGRVADATFAGAVYGAEQAVLPGLHVTPPITEWRAKEIGIDAAHHRDGPRLQGAAGVEAGSLSPVTRPA
jgi:hypothetical protein